MVELIKTIAIRFYDNYATNPGTIALHNDMIKKHGFVWYGKFGNIVSKEIINEQLNSSDPVLLLIKSGCVERYWVHFSEFIIDNQPNLEFVPEYYRNKTDNIKCWFKVEKFELAERDVLSKCFILSTGACLSTASRHCMNPYFKIQYEN